MEKLTDVVQTLTLLVKQPDTFLSKDYSNFKALTQKCCESGYCSVYDVEAFCDVMRNLCNPDIDGGSSVVQPIFDYGLLELVHHVLSICLQQFHANGGNDPGPVYGIMDTICILSDTCMKAKVLLAEMFSVDLLEEILKSLDCGYTIEVVTYLNLLLEHCPIQCREKLIMDTRIEESLQKMANIIYSVGDYEIQVMVMECLFRFVPRKHRASYANKIFPDAKTVKLFLEVRDSHFETDCRIFINGLNSQLEGKTRVFSYPCLKAKMGTQELKKPSDESYSEFWVDFNVGRNRMSLFCEQGSTDSQEAESAWETVSIWKKDVRSYNLDVEKSPITLTLSLTSSLEECVPSVCVGQKESYAIICFEANLSASISEALLKCFGKELSWTKSRNSSCKVSEASTPVHLKRQGNRLELLSQEDIEAVGSSQVSDQKSGGTAKMPNFRSSSFQKASVPAQPMRTPARLTVSEIQTKSQTQLVNSYSTPLKTVDTSKPPASKKAATCNGQNTPAKDRHESVKYSPAVEDKVSATKSKGQPSPKTPLSKRTRSSGKVKTPLVLQPTTLVKTNQKKNKVAAHEETPNTVETAKIPERKRKKMSPSKTSDEELGPEVVEMTFNKSAKSVKKRSKSADDNCMAQKEGTSAKAFQKTGDKEKRSKSVEKTYLPETELIPSSMPDDVCDKSGIKKSNPDKACRIAEDLMSSKIHDAVCDKSENVLAEVLTIPDSLPLDIQHSSLDTSKTEKKKNLNDSGISVQDTSDQEKDKSFTEKEKLLGSVRSAETTKICPSAGVKFFEKQDADKTSGEISIESSVECSATFPKRNLRCRPVPVAAGDSLKDSSQSPEKAKESPLKKPRGRKGNAKKGKAQPKRNTKSKDKNLKNPKKNSLPPSKQAGPLWKSQANATNFQDHSGTFPKLMQKLHKPSIGKKPVYCSAASPNTKDSFLCDPYDFDEVESKASSEFNKKNITIPKPNRIFTSRNIKSEVSKDILKDTSMDTQVAYCQLEVVSPTEMKSKKSFSSVEAKEKKIVQKGLPLSPEHTTCFGFDSPSKPEQNNVSSPENIQFKDVSSTLEGQDIGMEKMAQAPSGLSRNQYQLLTLQKINEKVKQTQLSCKKLIPSHVLNYVSSPSSKVGSDVSDPEDRIEEEVSPGGKKNNPIKKQQHRRKKRTVKNSPSSGSDTKDNDIPDDIVSNFKNICKGIVEGSIGDKTPKQRRCKEKPVKYKDMSESDISESPRTPGRDPKHLELVEDYEKNTDISSHLDRSELSWLGSQRKRKKSPVKTYKQKPPQKTNKPHERSQGFNFKSLTPLKTSCYPTLEDITKTLAAMQAEKRFEFDKMMTGVECEERGNSSYASKEQLKLMDDDDDDMEAVVDLTSPERTPKICRFRDTSGDEMEENDQQGEPSQGTPEPVRSGEVKPLIDDVDLHLRTPNAANAWNDEFPLLTPVSTVLQPEEEPSPKANSPANECNGFTSGPSSSKRLTKSAAKRKYKEFLQEDSEDSMSETLEMEENPALNSPEPVSLQPRKLFKSDQKNKGPSNQERNAFSCLESGTASSSKSLTSEESFSQMETEDFTIHQGVSAFIKTFGVDIQKQIKEKRRRLDLLTKGATKATQKHLTSVWDQQADNRSRLMGELKENMLLELLELEKDVTRLKDAEDQTVDFFKRQISVLQACRKSQEQRLTNLRRIHLSYGKGMEEMAATDKREHESVRNGLKSELVALHRKLLRDTQQQEMGKFRRSLKSLL